MVISNKKEWKRRVQPHYYLYFPFSEDLENYYIAFA